MKKERTDAMLQIRIWSAAKKDFKDLSESKGWTDGETLVELLKAYYSTNKYASPSDTIVLKMQVVALDWTRIDYEKSKPARTMTFRGRALLLQNMTTEFLDENTCRALEDEYGVSLAVYEEGEYAFFSNTIQHKIDVYFHNEKNCFLVHETIRVERNPDMYRDCIGIDPADSVDDKMWVRLYVERCKFVKSYDEFLVYFQRYASESEIAAVCHVLAPDIGKNYLLMDEYF